MAGVLAQQLTRIGPRRQLLLQVAVTLVACVIALLLPGMLSGYGQSVAVTVVTYALLGLGLNIVVGYAGLLDLGYAAFFAIGAYVSSLLELHLHLNFWETLPLGIVGASIAGCIIGYPTLRLRSDYLAIVTLGFGEIVRIIATNLTDITGGPNGLYGIPPATLFGRQIISDAGLYYLGLALLAAVIVFTFALARSRLGRSWRSLREDETAAEAVGVPTIKVKLLAYVMGAIVGSVAGIFFSARFGAIDPSSFTYSTSVLILIVVIVGGMGSIPGMLLGAVVVVVLPEALRFISNFRMLIFALALIALMLVRPEGLWPIRRSGRSAYAVSPDQIEELERRAPRVERPDPGELLLSVNDLSHRFGGVQAVDGVSLRVYAGQILAVIGPNGAGKTTLFNCITGMVRPDSGQVQLSGRRRSLVGMAPHRVTALGLARTFQGIRLFDGLSVAENALVGLIAHQSRLRFRSGLLAGTTTTDRAEMAKWLGFVGLGDKSHLLASELSYGDRRRLEIARALASEPLILLLDEPAAGSNPTEKGELMQLVRRIRDSGVAVVLIEHDMQLVMDLSDRVVVLDQGQQIAEGTPEQVQRDPRVIDAYLGQEEEGGEDTRVREVLGWLS